MPTGRARRYQLTAWDARGEGVWVPSSRIRLIFGLLAGVFGPLLTLPVARELTLPGALFVAVILVATLLGRLTAGLIASGVSIAVISYDIIPPAGSFELEGTQILDLALFLALAVVLAQLTARQDSVGSSLRESQSQMEATLESTMTGIWSWRVGGEVVWSDTMGPMFGLSPGSAPVSYEEFLELVHPHDRDHVAAVVAQALERGEDYEVEHRVVWADGTERWVLGQARVEKDADGKPVRLAGLLRDITARKRAELALRDADERLRELYEEQRRIAHEIQMSLMERRLPAMDRFTTSVRYRPSSDELTVGGDWYDVIDFPDGRVAAVVGDVVGHGLAAATAMGKLRSAANALMLARSSPAEMLSELDRFAERTSGTPMATIGCVVVDPEACTIRHASAGHPPPVVISADGEGRPLVQGRSAPLASFDTPERPEGLERFPVGATLVMYTDGLVEQRGESLDRGIQRLMAAGAEAAEANVEELADRLLNALLGEREPEDDVALLCLRLEDEPGHVLLRRFAASPEHLAEVRSDLRGWLVSAGAAPPDLEDVLLAAGEACANAVEHAYLGAVESGGVVLEARSSNGRIRLSVSDEGRWRTPEAQGPRGRGIPIMRKVMDVVEISPGPVATTVAMTKVLRKAAA